jgi:hypothetical protein
MKVGDLVKTKVPGFGTGKVSKTGIVIDAREFVSHGKAGEVSVMHHDGTFLKWYPWQLENMSKTRKTV